APPKHTMWYSIFPKADASKPISGNVRSRKSDSSSSSMAPASRNQRQRRPANPHQQCDQQTEPVSASWIDDSPLLDAPIMAASNQAAPLPSPPAASNRAADLRSVNLEHPLWIPAADASSVR
ncbi:hypothetical protein ACLOJK_024245, partial [Asimina triloba]